MRNNNKKSLPKVTKNEVFAWILAALMIFWTIASVLGVIGFARSCGRANNFVTASAETADTVNEGQYYIHIPADFVFHVIGEGLTTPDPEYFSVLSFDSGNYWFFFRVAFSNFADGGAFSSEPYSYLPVDNQSDLIVTQDFYLPINNDFAWNNEAQIILTLYDIEGREEAASYYTDNQVTNFIAIDFKLHSEVSYDTAYGEGYEAGLAQGRQEAQGRSFDDGYTAGQNVGYNRGFSEGRKEGITVGKQEGYATGYERGQADGLLVGKDIGFAEGVANSNDYSFMALMSSVIDAPVQAFTGLFNFDLLGVNLAGFAMAMLSLCAVLAVVRFVL